MLSAGSSPTRTGMVLMNNPTICSMPGTCAGRPDTVAPNTTSLRPVSLPSTIAHAACTTVFTVTDNRPANSARAAVTRSSSTVDTAAARPCGRAPTGASNVGSAPASACCHTATDPAASWSANQPRYRR